MSCITKLLEMKGDKEFLACHLQSGIEGGGTYKGYEYLISFTALGHRCGYVAIPHPVDWDLDDLHCHGGITYSGIDHGFKDLLDTPCADLWVGFDAAHWDDLPDYDTALKYFNPADSINILKSISEESYIACGGMGGRHRSHDYMVDECKGIIDQVIERHAA